MKVLNIRGIDEKVAWSFSVGAAARGWTQAEYLKQLLWLHSFVRLDYQTETWEWRSPDGMEGPDTPPEEAIWYPTEMPPEEFVAELGRYLSKHRLLAVQT